MAKVRIDPKTSLLRTFAHQDLSYKVTLGELIDNALDADATTIEILFHKVGSELCLTVKDNGRGAPDIGAMVTLGEHRDHPRTRSGRFGIGAKDAYFWIGGPDCQLQIETVHSGTLTRLMIDWAAVQRLDNWECDEPLSSPAEPTARGTSILIRKLWKSPPGGQQWANLVEELGYLYAPALKRGVQIKIGSRSRAAEPITKWEPPPLEGGHIDTKITVNGHQVRVYVGVVAAGHSSRKRGITYFLEGTRVIQEASANGCGDYSPAHVCGFVEVGKSWPLTKNKTTLANADALYAAVEAAARSVLERASKRSTEITNQDFLSGVQGMIDCAIDSANAKAKRQPGARKGRVNPTGRGGKHTRADVEQEGRTFVSGRSRSAIRVALAQLGPEPAPIAQFQRPNTVTLNLDHECIRVSQETDNRIATAAIVMSVLAVEEAIGGQQTLFRDENPESDPAKKFAVRLAGLLGQKSLFDGQKLLSVVAPAAE